jgi:hypothetical protein
MSVTQNEEVRQMEVLFQSLLLAVIGVCVWLAFRPARDELECFGAAEAAVPTTVELAAPVPGSPTWRREVVSGEVRLPQARTPQDDETPVANIRAAENDSA